MKSMKQNSRGAVLFIPLIFLASVAVIIISFFIIQNSQQTQKPLQATKTTQTTSTDTTANWNTYSNEKLSFELKYPPSWVANQVDYEDDMWLALGPPDPKRPGKTILQESIILQTETLKNDSDPSLEEYTYTLVAFEYDLLSSEDVVISGIPAKKLTIQEVRNEHGDKRNAPTDPVINIGFVYNDRGFVFLDIEESKLHTLNQILSTFKFFDNKASDKYFCETDNDCTKIMTCSEECVNREWLQNNQPSVAPGAYCGMPWQYGCKCSEDKCKVGNLL